jgi:hypothetical protein
MMMAILALQSNRPAAIKCMAQQMPLVRRALESMRDGWQAQLAYYDGARKVNSW